MSFPCWTLFQIIAGVDRNVGADPKKKEKIWVWESILNLKGLTIVFQRSLEKVLDQDFHLSGLIWKDKWIFLQEDPVTNHFN